MTTIYDASILLVDDNPDLLTLVTDNLRTAGYKSVCTATERALLQRLADDRGHIVTYDAVCEAVWGADYYGYENSLNVHIRHLREKIEPDPGHPQWLLTVRGIGYRLTGEV